MTSAPDRIATAIIDIIFTQPTPRDLRALITSLLRNELKKVQAETRQDTIREIRDAWHHHENDRTSFSRTAPRR
jgi:hypothetical protein